jgi:hypothetical protein
MGFGLIIGFIEHLKLITVNDYSTFIQLHTLQITIVLRVCILLCVMNKIYVKVYKVCSLHKNILYLKTEKSLLYQHLRSLFDELDKKLIAIQQPKLEHSTSDDDPT